MKKKVLLIQGLLAPYRYPIFEEISKLAKFDFEVWFMGKEPEKGVGVKNRIWDENDLKPFSFKYKFLNGITLNFGIKDNYPIWFNFSIWKSLFEHKPEIVVMMGWDSLTSFLVHIYCIVSKIKFVLYSDSTSEEKSWRRSLTKKIVSWHVKSSDSLISGGTRNARYLQALGACKSKIHISYNTVDIKRYSTLSGKFNKSKIKKELSMDGKKIIMYYAQFIERKGADILLSAFEILKKRRDDISLLLIGSGPTKIKIENLISKSRVSDVLVLENPGDIDVCKYYRASDLFILPSREDVWGLVVNEAMASRLPVIVSDKAGCSEDLVVNGFNGYTFKSGDVKDLVSKMETILKKDISKMGNNSYNLIKSFEPKITVGKFLEAIEF